MKKQLIALAALAAVGFAQAAAHPTVPQPGPVTAKAGPGDQGDEGGSGGSEQLAKKKAGGKKSKG